MRRPELKGKRRKTGRGGAQKKKGGKKAEPVTWGEYKKIPLQNKKKEKEGGGGGRGKGTTVQLTAPPGV